MYQKKILFLMMLFASFSLFANVTYTYHVSNVEVKKQNGYDVVTFENSTASGEVGTPELPYLGVSLLLPVGQSASDIKVNVKDRVTLDGNYELFPVQEQHPLSKVKDVPFVEADYEKIVYPKQNVKNLSTHFYSGYPIAFAAVTPVEYNAKTGEISYYKAVEVSISTQNTNEALEAQRFLKTDERVLRKLENYVDNTDEIPSFSQRDRDGTIDYLMVVESSKVGLWRQYKNFYNHLAYTVAIETVEDIDTNYEGNDLQEKIRNCIKDYYENNTIQYVLLGGDTDVIPSRGLYATVGEETDDNIPSDNYYSSFDGNWNSNGNNLWGEPEEADLIPEVAIGRFTYNDNDDIFNEKSKVVSYMYAPVVDEVKSALFIGEYLWDGPTWGGDYMDEMIDGSSANGYTTVGVPSEWDISTLYERDGNWEANDFLAELSNGHNLINHLGHSNTDYGMKIYNSHVTTSNIINNGDNHNFSILFTQGCYSGAFDNRTSYGSYGEDCLTEKLVELETGVVSMIANSRYGWGQQGSTNGASQYFHRQFNDAIFGEEIFDIGSALVDAKVDNIPFIDQGVMYWCHYETNLIGDPLLTVWTDTPQPMDVTYNNEILMGSSSFSVNVGALQNVKGALLYNDEVIGQSTSLLNGILNIELYEPLTIAGDLNLVIKAQNYLPFNQIISAIPGDGPYVIVEDMEISEIGDTIDGTIQSLDTIKITANFQNIGSQPVTGNCLATLSSESSLVNITSSTYTLPELGVDEEEGPVDAFEVELLDGILDRTLIPFSITITNEENEWKSNFSLEVHASEVIYENYQLIVINGEDNLLDPGESAELYFSFKNVGTGNSYNLMYTMSNYDEHITIEGESGTIASIPSMSSGINELPLIVNISDDFTGDSFILNCFAFDESGNLITEDITIPVGAINQTFESGMGEWTHESLSQGFGDEWHLSDYRNYSESGEYSMKCGGEGGQNYGDNLHSALISPVLPLPSNGFVKFHHWMRVEVNNSNPNEAWDGGIVEISINAGGFQQIEPLGGYPYVVTSNTASPFPPGIGVFSGNINWEEVVIDLSEYSGSFQIRFVLGTDANTNEEGWYIDDIYVGSFVDNSQDYIVPVTAMLSQNYPNPFNPVTTISFSLPKDDKVNLSIYNVKGQLVKTLVNKELSSGNHDVIWAGDADNGHKVSSGVYFYKLKTSNNSFTKKMILLK